MEKNDSYAYNMKSERNANSTKSGKTAYNKESGETPITRNKAKPPTARKSGNTACSKKSAKHTTAMKYIKEPGKWPHFPKHQNPALDFKYIGLLAPGVPGRPVKPQGAQHIGSFRTPT